MSVTFYRLTDDRYEPIDRVADGVIAPVTVTGPSTAIISPRRCTVPSALVPEPGSGDAGAE